MKIRINDAQKCENCTARRCKFLNVSEVKEDFFRLPSETSVCPTSAIDENGPADADFSNGCISSPDCVECGLCTKFCSQNNLVIEGLSDSVEKFTTLNELQLNAIASLYLHLLFGFSANTNRNRSLPFDCYVSSSSGKEAFVEVDFGNDSLECLRRILGDVVTFSQSHRISTGIIVLSSLPKAGSRDVYPVIESMSRFPTTTNLQIYITTFSILRMLCMAEIQVDRTFETLLFDCMHEDSNSYMKRIKEIVSPVKT